MPGFLLGPDSCKISETVLVAGTESVGKADMQMKDWERGG